MDRSVSVVIPIYNDYDNLKNCLGSLFNTDFRNFEIIVVDDGSSAGPDPVDIKYPYKLVRLPSNRGQAHARNVGVREAAGDIILFTDADCVVMKDWAKKISDELIRAHQESGGTIAVCGALRSQKGFVATGHSYTGYAYIMHGERKFVDYFNTANVALYKDAFWKVGGFSEDLRVSEDPDLALRLSKAGFKILFEPSIYVKHNHGIKTLKDFIKKHKDWGKALGLKLELKHQERMGAFLPLCLNPITHFLSIVPIALVTTIRIIQYNIKYDIKVIFYAVNIFVGKIFYRWGIFVTSLKDENKRT